MQPLFNLFRRIEKSVGESGINVALYYVEQSAYYKDFQVKLEKALFKQIKQVATKDNIERLLLFTKTDFPVQLTVEVKSLMEVLSALISMDAFLKRVGEAGGQARLDMYGVQAKFAMKNKALIKYFDDHTKLLIENVDDTTKEWIASKIQEGKNRMMNPYEISQMIINEGQSISKVRAEVIVITETANAISTVQKEVASKYGIKQQVWRTSIDERVCPICLPLEGKTATIGKNFPDGFTQPPAHPRCRCYLEDVIPRGWQLPDNPWTGE